MSDALGVAVERRLARLRARLTPAERRLAARSPGAMLEQRRGRVTALRGALDRLAADVVPRRRLRITALAAGVAAAATRNVTREAARLAALQAAFEARDPEALLQRGYAIVTVDGRVVTDPAAAPPGTHIEARLARGTLRARVERETADGGEQIRLL